MPTDTASSTIVDSASPPSVFSRTKRVFTTGEAGAACRLSQQTIIRACNSQKLRHWKVPGSKFRRINRNELLKFMKAEKIPTCAIEGEPTLLLIGVGATVNAALTTEFSAKNLGAVIGARSLFNAGQLVTAHCVEATLIAGALFSTPEQLQEFIREWQADPQLADVPLGVVDYQGLGIDASLLPRTVTLCDSTTAGFVSSLVCRWIERINGN